MFWNFEYHRESLVFWPSLAITRGTCECGACADGERATQIQLSFLFFTVLCTFAA